MVVNAVRPFFGIFRRASAIRACPRWRGAFRTMIVAGALAHGCAAAEIWITNTTDLVNGDTSSPAALAGRPGPDGISLREALLAANRADGPHAIRVARDLRGRRIVLAAALPTIARDGMLLAGAEENADPAITLDATAVRGVAPILYVMASGCTVRGFRFISPPDVASMLRVGGSHFPFEVSPREVLRDIRIEGNTFTEPAGTSEGFGILVSTTGGPARSSLANVTIAENSFDQMFEAVNIECGGDGVTMSGVVVENNRFSRIRHATRPDGSCIELSGGRGQGNRVLGTWIRGNVFRDSGKGIDINNNNAGDRVLPAADHRIEDTVIENNRFLGLGSDIQFEAGVNATARNNTIANTTIRNNVFDHTARPSIGIPIAANDQGAIDNRVIGVTIANNTFVGSSGSPGITDDGVSGVTILNTILPPGMTPFLRPEQVRHCITDAPGFAGVNGNITGPAHFVNRAAGDFRLAAGSPGIDAGTSDAAPAADADGRARFDDPATANLGAGAPHFVDIGAFEFAPAPHVVVSPMARTVDAGASVVLTTTVSGAAPFSYQWLKDETPIQGATAATLTIEAARPSHAGGYCVRVSNAAGSTLSAVVSVAIRFNRLVNLSTRASVTVGGLLTPGFVIRGAASKEVLVRGIGPALTAFGIGTPLENPRIDLFAQGAMAPLAANDDWSGAALPAAFARVGAFPLPAGSLDAALIASLAGGSYSAQMTASPPAAGIALAEVYDLEDDDAVSALVNVAVRGFVGAGENTLACGFVVRGNVPVRLLLRAVGPGLARFGVGQLLTEPQGAVYPAGASTVVGVVPRWEGAPELKAAFAEAGAFPLIDEDADAAAVVRLPPGAYTLVISGRDATTGSVLAEIYLLRD